METGRPSWSALTVAMTRAAHLFLDDEPKILRDDFALKFSGMENETALFAALERAYSEMGRGATPELFAPSYRAFMVLRQRYSEDELLRSLDLGISQYVILGAGLDSFAYRRQDLRNRLHVFEVDLPATQHWKRTRLRELDVDLPANLTFVPVDFEKQTMMDELCSCGYRKDVPSFFSWLGVVDYLTEAAVFDTLRQIVLAAPGSVIVFEYIVADPLLNEQERRVMAEGRLRSREPFRTQFDPVDLAKRLTTLGFVEVSDFGPEDAYAIYLVDRRDQLSASSLKDLPVSTVRACHLMKARVGGRP